MLSTFVPFVLCASISFFTWTCTCGQPAVSSPELLQVEIITVGNIYSNASLSNLPYIAPGMMVALEELRRTFVGRVNFTHTLVYDRRYTTCPLLTDNVDFLVAEYYYTRRKKDANMTVFIGVGCTERPAMGKLISGWNAFMMIGGAAETVFRNKALYPNVVLAGNNAVKSMHNIYTKFFQRFHWTSVYVLLDSSATPMHLLLIQNFVSGLAAKGFLVKFANTDMRNPEKINLSVILRDIRQTARVVVFLGYASDFRQFMVRPTPKGVPSIWPKFNHTERFLGLSLAVQLQAKTAEMVNGEYVYLAYEPFRHRSFYGNYTWKYDDQSDAEARIAFQSVFVVTFPQADLANERLVGLYDTFRNISRRDFNFTYAPLETPNPFVTAAYEDVMLFGKVLEETLNDTSRINLNNGSAFARRYWNRTFWLDTGPVEFDEVGERKQPLIVQQFQKNEIWPVTVMTLDASAQDFIDVAAITWIVPFPPPNEPPCGFFGTRVICRRTDTISTTIISAVVSVLVALVIGFFVWVRFWGRSLLHDVIKSFGWEDFQVHEELLQPRLIRGFSERIS